MIRSVGGLIKKNAFSLIELIVSTAILTIVVGGASLYLSQWLSHEQSSLIVSELEQKHLNLEQSIAPYIESAVNISGDSQFLPLQIQGLSLQRAGIQSVSQNSEPQLIIISEKLPVATQVYEVSGQLLAFDSTVSTSEFEQTNRQIMSDLIRTNQLFIITDAESTELVQIDPDSVVSTDTGRIEFEIDQELNRSWSSVASIKPASVHRIKILDSKLVIQDLLSGSQQVIAQNVSDLDLEYRFEDFDPLREFLTTDEWVSGPEEIDPDCTDPNCARWRDLVEVRVSYELQSIISRDLESENQHCSSGSHQVSCSYQSRFVPKSYRLNMNIGNDIEEDNGCRPDVRSHCRPECAQTFDSVDPSSPYWQGYADLNSAYCQCGSFEDGKFYSGEESRPSSYNPDNTANRSRWDHCAMHYGCEAPWIRNAFHGHPAYGLACECLQDDGESELIDEVISENGARQYHLSDRFDPAVQSIQSGQASAHLKCTTYKHCDTRLQRYFDSIDSNPTTTDPWEQSCGCKTYNLNYHGERERSITGFHLNWRRLCHADNIPGGYEACENTRTEQGQWKLRSNNGFQQALSPHMAAVCACLHGTYSESGNTIVPANPRDFDFRAARTAGDLQLCPDGSRAVAGQICEGLEYPTWGSQQSTTVELETVFLRSNGETQRASEAVTCDLSLQSSVQFSLGTCTSEENFQSNEVQTQYSDYSGWCNSRCLGGPQRRDEIQEIEEIITEGRSCDGQSYYF